MPNLFDSAKKERFLQFYAQCGRQVAAARAADVHPATVREHVKKDPEFKAQYDEAYSEYCESLEAEIERRGKDGVLQPIFHKGILVGHQREYSDTLILAHAKRHIPEYRDRHQVDVQHSGGVLVVPGLAKDADEWERKYGRDSRDAAQGQDDLPPGGRQE